MDPDGVRTRTLAHLADVAPTEMSVMLQSYRLAQARLGENGAPTTRYVIASQGYGRDARWRLLAKPDTDPKKVREARQSQMKWITQDMVRRVLSDVITEINPGLRGAETDQMIEQASVFLTKQVSAITELVQAIITNGGSGPNGAAA